MRKRLWLTAMLFAALSAAPAVADVLTYHNSINRRGAYKVANLTLAAAATMHRDTAFHGVVSGKIFAQPLYWRAQGQPRGTVIVATESNSVYALDETTGAVVWQTQLAASVPLDNLPCGNIDPMGITGTPVIDPATATLYLNAQTLDGTSARHMVYALSLSDGAVRTGWPLDVPTALAAKGVTFDSTIHGERSALLFFDGKVYVNYGGNAGDCGAYHGTVIEIQPGNPPSLLSVWRTRANRGGIWAQGGIAGDGSALYITTGNTSQTAGVWGDGEAVIRLRPGLARSDIPKNFFAPSNWKALDDSDKDLGGTEAIPLNIAIPGNPPARRIIAFGKDGNAYLLDRTRLGGFGGQLAILPVATMPIRTAPAVYSTSSTTMVAFSSGASTNCPGKNLTMLSVAASGPNPIAFAWCALYNGAGAPIVTTTDGSANAIVWIPGADGDNLLHGYNVLTGAPVFTDAGPPMSGLHHFQTLIATPRRFYIAGDNNVYAYTFTP